MRSYTLQQLQKYIYLPPGTAVKFIYLPVVLAVDGGLYDNRFYGKAWAMSAPCYAQPFAVGGEIRIQIEYDQNLPYPVFRAEIGGAMVLEQLFVLVAPNFFEVVAVVPPTWDNNLVTLFIKSDGVKWMQSEPIAPTTTPLTHIRYFNELDSEIFGKNQFEHSLYIRSRNTLYEEEDKEVYTDSEGGDVVLKTTVKPGTDLETELIPGHLRRIFRYVLGASNIRIDGVRHQAAASVEEDRDNKNGLGLVRAKLPAFRQSTITTL